MSNLALIPLKDLVPNHWNPNQMDDMTFRALGESIEEFGSDLSPLLVRPLGDKYQIIDGEHRFRWAKERKEKAFPCVVKELSDTQAKRLTQIMNRTRGKDDPSLLKELIDSLLSQIPPDEIIRGWALDTEAELNCVISELEQQIDKDLGLSKKEAKGKSSKKELYIDESGLDQKCPKCGFEFKKSFYREMT